MADQTELRIAAVNLLECLDELMPLFEEAIRDAWDKGDYVNGPRFGTAIEALRRAADAQGTEAFGGDVQQAPSRSDDGPVGEADAPKE